MLEAVTKWREKGIAPDKLMGRRTVDGKVVLEMQLPPYPAKSLWDANTSNFKPVDGPRAGVERIAASFRPAAAE